MISPFSRTEARGIADKIRKWADGEPRIDTGKLLRRLQILMATLESDRIAAPHPPTKRQRQVLDFIRESYDAAGFAPTLAEIAERFGFRSLATVHEHLTNLERKGHIRREYNRDRAIQFPDDHAA